MFPLFGNEIFNLQNIDLKGASSFAVDTCLLTGITNKGFVTDALN